MLRHVIVWVISLTLIVGMAGPVAAATTVDNVTTQGASCKIVGRPSWNGTVQFKATNFTGGLARITCWVKLRWVGGYTKFRSVWYDVPAYSTRYFRYRWFGNWEWIILYRVTIQHYDY